MTVVDQERNILDLTGDLWNEYVKLPVYHPDDAQEFSVLIHTIQRHILARSGERSLPGHKVYAEDLTAWYTEHLKAPGIDPNDPVIVELRELIGVSDNEDAGEDSRLAK